MRQLDKRMLELINRPSDINEHLLTLYSLSLLCESVVEFGIRYGVSSTALINAQSQRAAWGLPARYHGYDINPAFLPIIGQLKDACQVQFECQAFQKDTADAPPIGPCDMLFIDTRHTFAQVHDEIYHHANSVSKYLVFHDTVTFGDIGEDAKSPGLWEGIIKALESEHVSQRGGWTIQSSYPNNNGLTVFTRLK